MNSLSKKNLKTFFSSYHKYLEGGASDETYSYQIYTLSLKGGDNKFYQFALNELENFTDEIFITRAVITLKQYDIVSINLKDLKKKNESKGVWIIPVKELEIVNDNLSRTLGNPKHYQLNEQKSYVQVQKEMSKKKTTRNSVSVNQTVIDESYTAIRDLSTFTTDSRMLLRLVYRSELSSFTNQKGGESKIIRTVFCDHEGTETSVALFNKTAEKFTTLLEKGRVYIVENAEIRINDKFRKAKSPDYTFNFNDSTKVTPVDDERASYVPILGKSCLVDICKLGEIKVSEIIDVLCYVKTDFPLEKKKETLIKRYTIVSAGSAECELSFFNDSRKISDSLKEGIIVLIRSVKVSEFRGLKNLNAINDTIIEDEIGNLKKAFSDDFACLTQIRNILKSNPNHVFEKVITEGGAVTNSGNESAHSTKLAEMIKHTENLLKTCVDAKTTKTEVYKIRGRVAIFQLSDNSIYPACPGCKKKLFDEKDCSFCQKNDLEPNWTYRLRFAICDASKICFVDCFGALGEKITDKKAGELRSLDLNELNKEIKNNNYKKEFSFIIKPKIESYSDQLKIKYNILNIITLDSQNRKNEANAIHDEILKKLSNYTI